MRAFAEMLLDAGETVIGTDRDLTADLCDRPGLCNPHSLTLCHPDHAEQIFANTPASVVYSMAVSESCPLLLRCRSLGVTPISLRRDSACYLNPAIRHAWLGHTEKQQPVE